MIHKFLSTIYLFLFSITLFAFVRNENDTDFFMLKNGYSFKADIVDTSGKYYVYKVYRGERLLRCVKKDQVIRVQPNYVTPVIVAATPPAETKPADVYIPPVVVPKKKFNPYIAPLRVRKGFETIDTVRILYDLDVTHYLTDENAVNAFFAPVEMGPRYRQGQLDSATYTGPKVNNRRTGSGMISFDNGAIFSGKIANNVLQGYGSYSDEIIDYRGMFNGNKLNGLGICYYYDSQFEGILKDIVFKGEFRDSKFWEGEVFYTTLDDKHYIQQFKQGNPSSAKHFDE